MNKYFSSQCNPLPNNSKLPEYQTYITETKLSSFDMYKMIKTLDISKAHGHYEVSIKMLKLRDKNIVKPRYIIFKSCKLKKIFQKVEAATRGVL